MQYTIPSENLSTLTARFEKLQKRARKLGQEISLKTVDTLTEKKDDPETGIPRVFVKYVIEVEGAEPKINGWTFIATIQHVNEVGNILRSIPGVELPEKYRTATPENCDHCGISRFRKDTYVLQHEDGTTKQVGSTCIKDFIGWGDPHRVAKFAELCVLIDGLMINESGYNGPRRDDFLDTETVIQLSASAVRTYGWLSRKNAEFTGKATADRVLSTLFPPNPKPYGWEPLSITAEDRDMAQKAIDWVRDVLGEKERNDYEHNLYVVVSAETMETRSVGLAASVIFAYQEAVDMLKQREATQSMWANSQYQGEVGKRSEYTLTVVSVRGFDTDFGTSYQHIMTDGENQYLWYGSKELEEATYTFKATVKGHKEFNGIKQTILTRVMGETIHSS